MATRHTNAKHIPLCGNQKFTANHQLNQTNKCVEKKTITCVKRAQQKLITENAIITQVDKGKTVVVINQKEYSEKVHSFITANNFNTVNKDPTIKFKKAVHKIMKECSSVIDKRQTKFLIQKKPSASVLKAQLKLHKTGIPICPVINNRTAPTYTVN